MDFTKIDTVRLEIKFKDGNIRSAVITPEAIQDLMSFHDISALDETLKALMEQKENEIDS